MADEHKLIVWARGWFTAEIQRGRAFEDIRAQFNAASPLLVSFHNVLTAPELDETPAIVDAITRAFERADAMADD